MDAVGSAWPTAEVGTSSGERIQTRPYDTEQRSDLPESELPRAQGSRIAKLAVAGADAVAVATAMLLAALVRHAMFDAPEAIGPVIIVAVVALPVWLGVFARYKLYTAAAVTSFTAELRRILHAVAAASAGTGLVSVVFAQQISRVWLLCTMFFALGTVVVERTIVRQIFRRARSHGRFQRSVVVIGTNAEALAIVQMLGDNTALGYHVVGLVECGGPNGVVAPVPVLGNWRDTVDILRSLDANGVIIATSAIEEPAANRLARELMECGYHVELTSGLVDISADRLLTRPLGRRPVMYIEPVRLAGWRAVAKRSFDTILAALALFFAAPVLLVSAILIKLDSRGPVFFSQVRVGRKGKLFRVWKLRTMVADAEDLLDDLRDRSEVDGPLFKMRDDPRLTRVGAFLRKLSLDELPQLWNVLRGEMSMVGPRPALPSEVSEWSEEVRNRLRVKPGITGMWQVNGRSQTTFDDYVRHDLYYVDNWSLLTDLAIVAKTVPVVLLRRGAY
ncbi:MAG: putative undecaprenyl-phosphate glycosylphosphotransferase [Actinomycetia bacterium]|nr:putative undecaprenyl-phosphate glycosylphosphotransferase [Actinomycetes bacterium]